ncbi:hypothetical protein BD779DRAFT_332767 [Infundibulicybe gibba]|nr:hypothetical protein BD779DRAFT_332767 [Infundibulicybe gibba]
MSARTPFVPSRPATSMANPKDQPTSGAPATNAFIANRLNPLHTPGNDHNAQAGAILKQNSSDSQGLATDLGHSHSEKPLNMTGLVKRRNTQTTSHGLLQNQESSLQSGNSILRPETADPAKKSHSNHRLNRDRAQNAKILAPVPRRGQPVSLANLAAGEPNISGSKPLAAVAESAGLFSPGSQAPGDAHIPTSELGFSFAKSNLNSKRSIPEPAGDNDAGKSGSFNDALKDGPLTANSGSGTVSTDRPQRIFVNSDDPILIPRSRNSLKATHHSNGPQAENLARSHGKRTRADLEDDPQQTQQRPKHQRKSMGDVPEKTRTPPVTYNTPSPPQPSSPYQPYELEYHGRDQNILPRSQDQNAPYSHAIDRLLGCDSGAYIEDHWEKYEQAVAKWKNCSMDEWIAGADDIVARYAKILDFVKAHMTAKLDLFAGFHKKIDQHNTVLEERSVVLLDARQRLVTESTQVLGGGQEF